MIDVIIPAYSPSERIRVGLMSITTQLDRDNLNVVLVNDCSPNTDCNYQDLIDEFKDLLNIKCIKTPQNCGQGLARQYGIDFTKNDYFTFMDDDDQFGSNFVMYDFASSAKASEQRNPGKKCAFVGVPICNLHNKNITKISMDKNIFVNAKCYNRKFINEFNIRFHPDHSWVGEDYYFCFCLYFALNCNADKWMETRVGDNPFAYFWMDNPNSQSQSDDLRIYSDIYHFSHTSADLIKWEENMKSKKTELIRKDLSYMLGHSYYHVFGWISKVKERDIIFMNKFGPDAWNHLRQGANELRELAKKYNITKEDMKPIFQAIRKETDMQNFIKTATVNITEYINNGCPELFSSDLLKAAPLKILV